MVWIRCLSVGMMLSKFTEYRALGVLIDLLAGLQIIDRDSMLILEIASNLHCQQALCTQQHNFLAFVAILLPHFVYLCQLSRL